MTRRESAHTHPCAICEAPVPCEGELLLNHDGFPAVICTVRHRYDGEVLASYCETHELTGDAPIDGDAA